VARELANLSSIHHARGEHGEALAMLAPILSDGRIPFQSRHRVEAAYRAAVITAPGHPREAGEWLDRAEQYCQSDCEAQGRILNLRARLRLGEKRTGEAQTLARRALSLHEKRADRQEMANSLRLLGDIALASANPAEARAHYQRALETDKDEAIPHKIVADLMGIGRSLAVEGRREEAATYFRRARDVADAAGQNAAVIEADIQIKRDGY
jgi:tetratricopeptide (TPR) repeat protein